MIHDETDPAKIQAEVKKIRDVQEKAEMFFHAVKRRMIHGFVTAPFLREELNKVMPEWETDHSEAFMENYWGPRCAEDTPSCACCDAWHQYDYRKKLGISDAEVLFDELIQRDYVDEDQTTPA